MLKPITKKTSMTLALTFAAVLLCCVESEASLLKGHIKTGKPIDIIMAYDYQGDTMLDTITTDSSGNFSFEGTIPEDRADVSFYINNIPYGARLKKGTMTIMDIDETVTFSGDNVAESKMINAYNKAFFPMNYKPAPDMPFVFSDYLEKLDHETSAVKQLISEIDPSERDYYTRLTDARRNYFYCVLASFDDDADHSQEVKAIEASVDPDDDMARLSGLLSNWFNNNSRSLMADAPKGSFQESRAYLFNQIDKTLNNEGNKKNLWTSIGTMYAMYRVPDDEINNFLALVDPIMKKAPKVKETILEVHKMMKPKVADGNQVPADAILLTPDGKEIKFSDLIGKKVVYIDFWATWCAPCCAEIPYMEKLVEQFKGDDTIEFISISSDNDRAKWMKKLDRDKPEWPQYIFESKSGDKFMNAMGISGIPRFIIIGKDGRIFRADAPRPSSVDKITADLKAAMAL